MLSDTIANRLGLYKDLIIKLGVNEVKITNEHLIDLEWLKGLELIYRRFNWAGIGERQPVSPRLPPLFAKLFPDHPDEAI